MLPIISVLAENTLLKTAYHFLLLLVGFDTLTYRKDYDRSLMLVGHQGCPRHPKVIFKDNQELKLGDAPEGIPSFVFVHR